MEPATPTKKIVIVEDNQDLAAIYKTRLEMQGYTCFVAYNGIVGLYFIQKERPDLVLLDLMVPDIAGDQILLRMRGSEWGRDIKVLIVSNLNEADAPAGLRELGIEDYAVKALLSGDQLYQMVDAILQPAGQPAAAVGAAEAQASQAAPSSSAGPSDSTGMRPPADVA